jgi:glutamate dehydrogenase (NAD(P)+)
MEKRFDEVAYEGLIGVMENLADKKANRKDLKHIIKGAEEIDLVNSGLEETMIFAYNQTRETWKKNKKVEDLRTAAFVNSINKIANDYLAMGIFP